MSSAKIQSYRFKVQRVMQTSLLLVVLIGMPLLGVAFVGQPITQYLEFPPLTRYVSHAPFSWQVFLACTVMLVSLSFVGLRILVRSQGRPHVYFIERKPFPWWGWIGLGLTLVAWILAWTRFPWFATFQLYTFTPPLGWIYLGSECLDVSPHRTLLDEGPSLVFFRVIPTQCCVLVVFRIPQSIRTKLVLLRSRRFFCFQLRASCNTFLFHRSAGCSQY